MIPHLLILFIILTTTSPSTSQPNCPRVCKSGGHQNSVPYPFGFSTACEIPLNCTGDGQIRVNEYNVQNITNSHILIDFPPQCDRPFHQIYQFNNTNFALTSLNGLLLSNCTSTSNTCVFPATTFGNRFTFPQCGNGTGSGVNNRSMSCYTDDSLGQDEFINLTRVAKGGSCRVLVSSAVFDPNGSVLRSRASVELGWWVRGECGCDENAGCRNVVYENRRVGYRCECRNGYAGDGFVRGNGCHRDVGARRSILHWVIIALALGVGGVTIATIAILCLKGKLRWRKKAKDNAKVETFLKNQEFLAPKRYTYSQVKKMTNSFDTKLGQGGFGYVYKGVLSNQDVAVKVLSEVKGNGEDFMNEVASVGRTSHVNIVGFVGFCLEGHRKALIYEFMPNGSLERFIYGRTSSSSSQLGWEKLHEIAIGIARGLEYLHKGCNTRILHLDIKPHNILLDQNMCPKISDFGLSKLFPDRESMISMSRMRGTPGYIAPELFFRNFGQVSHKSDVYSYGMMVLEMVGGRKNVEVEVDHTSEIYFPHWIYKKLDLDEDQLGLHGIASDEENEMARKMIIVGLWCIQTNPSNRPTITKVLEMLEGDLLSLEIPPKPYLSSPSRSPNSLFIDESYN